MQEPNTPEPGQHVDTTYAIPDELKPIIEFLHTDFGMHVKSVHRDDAGFQEISVVMQGELPLAAIAERFRDDLELRVGPASVFNATSYATVSGSESPSLQ